MTERLDTEWLARTGAREVLGLLGETAARVVGGAVRDQLLGRPIKDIDIATQLLPEAVLAKAQQAGWKAVPTGLSHGTVTLVVNARPFEVTTLRRDVQTDGRHAKVAFTQEWRADAERRDFTMNALYLAADGTVTDFFGGIADARAGRVRFIGAAQQRIKEDALRILRFFRFHAHYGAGVPDRDGLAACRAAAERLDRLSAERVREELLKLLAAVDPLPVLQAMHEAGILARILPEAGLDGLRRLLTAEARVGVAADPLRRLAALLPDAQAADQRARALKLSNRQRDRLLVAIGPLDRPLSAALYRIGPEGVRDRLLLADAVDLEDALNEVAGWQRPRFPLTAQDLLARGVKPGPALGRCLAEAEEAWIASRFSLDKQALLARACRQAG
ncbi:MAG: CCA tRNA nucleotidyltransferase [Rhodothalassiaceae bacterium]